MDVNLVMFRSDGTRREFPVRKKRLVIGRTSACDLRIPLASVSRKHCELLLDDIGVRLHDLGSSNGTWLNGQRIDQEALDPGDEITIGPVTLTLVVNGEPNRILAV